MIYGCSIPGGDMEKLNEMSKNNYLEIGWSGVEKPHLQNQLNVLKMGDIVYVRKLTKEKVMHIYLVGIVYKFPKDSDIEQMILRHVKWKKCHLFFNNISEKGIYSSRKSAIYQETAEEICRPIINILVK